MKKKLLTTLSNKVTIAAIAACFLTAGIISSCTKSSDTNYANQFIGTWNVKSNTCGAATGTFVIAAGSGANSLTNSGTCGNPGCVKAITITGTASANSFVFPVQTFTDACGLSYTISITGNLSGGTLTYTEIASGVVSFSCSATATK